MTNYRDMLTTKKQALHCRYCGKEATHPVWDGTRVYCSFRCHYDAGNADTLHKLATIKTV